MKTVGWIRRTLAIGVDTGVAAGLFLVAVGMNIIDVSAYQPPHDWFLSEWLLKNWLDQPNQVITPVVVFVVMATLLNAGWELLAWSPGGLVFRTRVVGPTGERPEVWRVLVRWLGIWLNVATLGLGYLWALADAGRMAFHDHLSGTCVVTKSS